MIKILRAPEADKRSSDMLDYIIILGCKHLYMPNAMKIKPWKISRIWMIYEATAERIHKPGGF